MAGWQTLVIRPGETGPVFRIAIRNGPIVNQEEVIEPNTDSIFELCWSMREHCASMYNHIFR